MNTNLFIPVSGPIAPYSSDDVYSTHDSKYGKGGYREVTNLLERDNISIERRSIGMTVYVEQEDKIYILSLGLTNANWRNLSDFLEVSGEGGESKIYISTDEPSSPIPFSFWLNPITFVIRIRNNDNTKWEHIVAEEVNDPHIDYGVF